MEYKRIQTFGRKKARGLSENQQNALTCGLKDYRIDIDGDVVDPRDAFHVHFDRVVVEIGFGHGEHLVESAALRPDCVFIGCEPFENGVARAVTKIQERDLKNVLLFMGDSRDLLDRFRGESVFEFNIMFPDPWPKKRHIKRRLVSVEFMRTVDRLLLRDGVVKIASDCEHYIEHVFDVVRLYNLEFGDKFRLSSDDLRALSNKPEGWGSTRYEQKALNKGKKCYYLTIYRNK